MKEDVSPPEVVCELGYVTDVSYNNASRCISEFPARLSLDLARAHTSWPACRSVRTKLFPKSPVLL
jgi:hypothetical protein